MGKGRGIGLAALFAVACSPAAAMVAPADPEARVVDGDAAAATVVTETPFTVAAPAPASDPVAGDVGTPAAPAAVIEVAAQTPSASTPPPTVEQVVVTTTSSTTVTTVPTTTSAPATE